MNLTEAQYAEVKAHMARLRMGESPAPPQPKRKRESLGGDRMNGTEAAWAEVLEARRKSGAIRSWEFQGIRLKLAPHVYFTPDFFVVMANGEMECCETKGFMREAARVRLLTAAKLYPWLRFYLIRRKLVRAGGGWDVTLVGRE